MTVTALIAELTHLSEVLKEDGFDPAQVEVIYRWTANGEEWGEQIKDVSIDKIERGTMADVSIRTVEQPGKEKEYTFDEYRKTFLPDGSLDKSVRPLPLDLLSALTDDGLKG